MIDTHSHLNFPALNDDLEQVLARAHAAGVTGFVVPGTSAHSSAIGVTLASEYSDMWAAVGIHPTDTEEEGEREKIESLIGLPGVVAIGEVGLDYYHLPPDEDERERLKKVQHERLRYFIALAKHYGLPLIIHSRDCFEDMFTLMSREAQDVPFVIHCFTGTKEEAEKWLSIGGHISFTGIITYPKNSVLREVVAYVPWERLMIETDAPFLPPEKHRGELGEPQYVLDVARCVAECKGVTVEEVDTHTTATAQRFFGLN